MRLPAPDQMHSTEQAAAALGVPAGTIRQWAARGKVVAAGRMPAPGRGGFAPLYWLAELQDLADAYHARASRHATPHTGYLHRKPTAVL